MSITKKILVLTLLQGLLCQRWEFPSEIVGLIGSCVEIPCTFHPLRNSRTSSTVWYLFHRSRYPQIFNSQGSAEVLMAYRGRTSLVPGSSSCSLRIDPVRRDDGDDYYPGMAEDRGTNAYSLHRRFLQLHVTDTPSKPELTGSNVMFEGRPTIFTCYVEHTCGSSPTSLKWNKPGQTERRSVDLSGGKWREISRLRYIPSHEDDKTQIQCTASYHNGGTSRSAATLDIRYAAEDVTVSLPENTALAEDSNDNQYSSILLPILVVLAGVILLIIIVYFYIRNKTRQKSRHENSQFPDATYTDLVKTEVSKDYDTLQPSCPAPPAAGGKDLTSDNQYENLG